MNNKFILSCESTIDLPYSYISGRDIPVLFYTYTVDGKEYPDDMGKDPTALSRFYSLLSSGKMPSTSQINTYRYEEYFRDLLEKGDVLHIAFGSGMTPSVKNALEASDNLKKEFPNRRLEVIDSFCSCSGYGILVDMAADLKDSGASMDEVIDLVNKNRRKIHHQFFSTDIKFFKRSGRVSGPTAAIATVLGICPIMHLNYDGRIISYDKARGKKNAIKTTVNEMIKHAENGKDYSGKCYISHSNCLEDAVATKQAILNEFKNLKDKIEIYNIGTIIASHCGPGTVAVFFIGDEREK